MPVGDISLMALNFDGLCTLLQVFDMPTSVKFYCEVLGFDLVTNSPIVHSPQGNGEFQFQGQD